MSRLLQKAAILLAGENSTFADLGQKIKSQGISLYSADDGNQALQKAIDQKPAMVIIDTALQTIPADRFAQILRTNRQGGDLSIVFVGHEGEEVEGFVRHRDRFFARPLNTSQIASYIEKHFSRVERAEQLLRQKQEVEGSLDQLAIVDLLQLFGLNGKSGTLYISHGNQHGTISLQNGQVTNAQIGRVDGEKALYRLILWNKGSFRFTPGGGNGPVKISAPTDHLIMEGLRLGDEADAQAERLPALHTRMELVIPYEQLPQGLRPATREILTKLESYPRVSDLLDHCPYADLQILQVLQLLREKGVISEGSEESTSPALPLLAATDILSIHQLLYGVGRIGDSLSAIVVLLSPSPKEVREFLPVLQAIPEFVLSSPLDLDLDELFSPIKLGQLRLTETFSLRFLVLPPASEYSPLWSLYTRQLFGVLSLAPVGSFPAAEQVFSSGGSEIIYLDKSRRQGLVKGGRTAIQELLSRFLPRFQKDSPEAS